MADGRRLLPVWPTSGLRRTGMRASILAALVGMLAATALAIAFGGPAQRHGATIERREAPDRPGVTTHAADISTEALARALNGAGGPQWVIWTASLHVPAGGIAGFRLQAKDGAQLFVDSRLAVQSTGRDEVTRQVRLPGGAHDLRLIYEHLEGTPEIRLEWIDPAGTRTTIPPAALAPRPIPRVSWLLRPRLRQVAIALCVAWVTVVAAALAAFAGPGVVRALELGGLASDPALRVVLAFSLLLLAYPFWWGLPVHGYWAMDEIGPLPVSHGASVLYSGGWHEKYPPLHYYLLNAVFLPFFGAARLGAFSMTDPDVHAVASALGRVLSIVLALGSVSLLAAAATETLGRAAALLGATVWTLVLPFVYHGKLATLDVPYTFWFALSFLGYARAITRGTLRDHLLFAGAAVLAVCTKDQAYGLFALPALHIAYTTITRSTGGSLAGRLFDRRLTLSVLCALLIFAAVHNLPFNSSGFLAHVRVITGSASSDYRMYGPGPSGQLALLADVGGQILFCMGWPAALAALAGITRGGARTGGGHRWLLLPAASYYLTFLAVVGYCYDRFLLPVAFVLAIFAGHGMARLLDMAAVRRRWLLAAGAAFAYTAVRAASVNLMMAADARDSAARWLQAHVPPSALVASAGPQEYYPPYRGRFVGLVPTMNQMDQAKPDFIVVNAGYRRRFVGPSWVETPVFTGLENGTLPYRAVHRIRHATPLAILAREEPFRENTHVSHTSLNKLNPELVIYQRVEPSR